MRLIATIRLIAAFYRSFILASSLITMCCIILLLEYGYSIFMAVFWLKACSMAIIYQYINNYKQQEYYYYYNLGVSKLLLWGATLSFDFILFIILLTQTYKLK